MAKKDEAYPWWCRCGRLNRKTHDDCPKCRRHWSTGERHYTNEEEQEWDEREDTWTQSGREESRRRARGSTPRGRNANPSPRRQGPGKKKGKQEEAPFKPFATPWPKSETGSKADTPRSKKPAQIPLPPSRGSIAASGAASANAELLGALRKHYPDMATAPADIQEAVQKAETLEKLNSKQIAKELNRASQKVGEAAQQLAELKDMQERHRDAWVAHLKEALVSWESQVQSYVEQQKTYRELMTKARAELEAARLQTQRLNVKAGTTTNVDTQIDLTNTDDPISKDEEASKLVGQVQELLEKSARVIKMEPKEEDDLMVSSGDESAPKKRPRSMEPFATGAGGGLQSHAS